MSLFDTSNSFAKGTLGADNNYGGILDDSIAPGSPGHNVLNDWLHPNVKEFRQMGEQLIMDEIEPSARMEGLIAAGINPLTAAAGIAGSQSQAPTPASSVNPIGDVASAVGAVAGATNDVSSAISTLAKTKPEIDELNSRSKANLAKAGLDDANTNAVITDNKYRGENWEADLNLKRQQFSNMKQELSNMKATHREIMTHCDEMISQIELNGSTKDYYDIMQLKIAEDLRWQKQLHDWRIANKLFVTESGVDGYIFNMLYNEYGDDNVNAFFDAFYEYCQQRSEALNKGRYSAEAEFANEIAFARKNGENASDIVYNRYGSMWNFFGSLQHFLARQYRKINTDLETAAGNDDASAVRRSMTDALNALYDEMNADPSQTPALRKKIMELQSILQLSNSELLEYVKRNK